jgi:hypothetical protein
MKFQVHGHNSRRRALELTDSEGIYGFNLDSSSGKKLTGLHWPTMEIFEQDFIE